NVLDFLDSSDKDIVIEENRVYLRHLFIYETKLADNLTNIVNYKKNASDNSSELGMLNHKIKNYQTKKRIIIEEKQKEASKKKILSDNFLTVTGGTDNGKTTVVKGIIDIYKQINQKGIVKLCAPTGRASKNLEDTTGYKASTIHRMIGLQQYGEMPIYNEQNK